MSDDHPILRTANEVPEAYAESQQAPPPPPLQTAPTVQQPPPPLVDAPSDVLVSQQQSYEAARQSSLQQAEQLRQAQEVLNLAYQNPTQYDQQSIQRLQGDVQLAEEQLQQFNTGLYSYYQKLNDALEEYKNTGGLTDAGLARLSTPEFAAVYAAALKAQGVSATEIEQSNLPEEVKLQYATLGGQTSAGEAQAAMLAEQQRLQEEQPLPSAESGLTEYGKEKYATKEGQRLIESSEFQRGLDKLVSAVAKGESTVEVKSEAEARGAQYGIDEYLARMDRQFATYTSEPEFIETRKPSPKMEGTTAGFFGLDLSEFGGSAPAKRRSDIYDVEIQSFLEGKPTERLPQIMRPTTRGTTEITTRQPKSVSTLYLDWVESLNLPSEEWGIQGVAKTALKSPAGVSMMLEDILGMAPKEWGQVGVTLHTPLGTNLPLSRIYPLEYWAGGRVSRTTHDILGTLSTAAIGAITLDDNQLSKVSEDIDFYLKNPSVAIGNIGANIAAGVVIGRAGSAAAKGVASKLIEASYRVAPKSTKLAKIVRAPATALEKLHLTGGEAVRYTDFEQNAFVKNLRDFREFESSIRVGRQTERLGLEEYRQLTDLTRAFEPQGLSVAGREEAFITTKVGKGLKFGEGTYDIGNIGLTERLGGTSKASITSARSVEIGKDATRDLMNIATNTVELGGKAPKKIPTGSAIENISLKSEPLAKVRPQSRRIQGIAGVLKRSKVKQQKVTVRGYGEIYAGGGTDLEIQLRRVGNVESIFGKKKILPDTVLSPEAAREYRPPTNPLVGRDFGKNVIIKQGGKVLSKEEIYGSKGLGLVEAKPPTPLPWTENDMQFYRSLRTGVKTEAIASSIQKDISGTTAPMRVSKLAGRAYQPTRRIAVSTQALAAFVKPVSKKKPTRNIRLFSEENSMVSPLEKDLFSLGVAPRSAGKSQLRVESIVSAKPRARDAQRLTEVQRERERLSPLPKLDIRLDELTQPASRMRLRELAIQQTVPKLDVPQLTEQRQRVSYPGPTVGRGRSAVPLVLPFPMLPPVRVKKKRKRRGGATQATFEYEIKPPEVALFKIGNRSDIRF